MIGKVGTRNHAKMGVSNPSPVLLVGTGRMAVEYARVLAALQQPFIAVGRGAVSAERFSAQTGEPAYTGGLERWLNGRRNVPGEAIVAVNVEQLARAVEQLLLRGVKKVLVEKPGGLHAGEICRTSNLASRRKAAVFVAYNRRFYASVKRARELIAEDGGVSSFSFEFTELSQKVEASKNSAAIKENWLLANSTHVIDLAFHLGGAPARLHCFTAGSTSWHPAGAVFAGAGVTSKGALFTCRADWGAPGNWSVEMLTRKRRLFLAPLEELYEQRESLGEKRKVSLDDRPDREYKPGIYRMTRAFLYGKDLGFLPTIQEQCSKAEGLYLSILKGE